ncbi:MAG: hypothetical protein R3C19_15065 [Planctomycetaceae bacterium]
MFQLFRRLVKDQQGMILSSEVVLVGTILVLGAIAGLTSLQYAVTHELNDAANAYDSRSQYGGSGDTYTVHDSTGVPEVSCNFGG